MILFIEALLEYIKYKTKTYSQFHGCKDRGWQGVVVSIVAAWTLMGLETPTNNDPSFLHMLEFEQKLE